MKELQCFLIILAITAAYAQRVVPGVNPQHYQQQPQYQQQVPQMQYAQPGQVPQMQPPMQQQQQQMHQQPMHQQQQQQMPQQPMMQQQAVPPQQPMMQQPPVVQQQTPHHHQQPQQQQQQQFQHDPNAIHQQPHLAGHRPQIFDAANIQGDKAHIQDHIEVPLDTSKMSEQELQFHYFKMHDTDHNNKLDGSELIKSLIHWHEKGSKEDTHQHEGAAGHEDKIFSDEELIALIDPILEMDDTSRDGFIDYPEFIKAQEKAAAQNKAETP